MEPHSHGSQPPPHSAFGRAFFFFSSLFTHHASDLAISGIAFLASKACLGNKLFLTTVALFAIDISIPNVSAFRYLQSWGYRKPLICRSRKIARHTPTCICHSVLYSFSFLIPVSSSLRIPTYKRTIRAYCRTYTLPTRRNRAWLTFSFVHQYIFKRSLPERNHSGGWKNYIYPSDLELYFILCPIGTGRIVLVVS